MAGTATGRRCSAAAKAISAPSFGRTLRTWIRFLVIDRWEDAGRYDAFRTRFAAEYDELDRACAVLTAEETPVGRYHVDLQSPINGTAG